jgi:hypothetical protein
MTLLPTIAYRLPHDFSLFLACKADCCGSWSCSSSSVPAMTVELDLESVGTETNLPTWFLFSFDVISPLQIFNCLFVMTIVWLLCIYLLSWQDLAFLWFYISFVLIDCLLPGWAEVWFSFSVLSSPWEALSEASLVWLLCWKEVRRLLLLAFF